jgi:photosystem II stability/assembly factor-like uncharacterized protein
MSLPDSLRPDSIWKRFLAPATLIALAWMPIQAQSTGDYQLHVAVLQTNNFVVGPGALPSGFFAFEGDTTWSHMGWKKSRHNGISFNPNDPSIIFMACGNGVFRTLDGGQNWKIVTSWNITEIQDVTVDSQTPSTIHIATAYGLFRSTDNGDTWQDRNDGIPEMKRYSQTIHADYSKGGHVIAGGESGIFRTTNGGDTWGFVGPSIPIRDVQQSRSNPEFWMAGTEDNGVYFSRDGGETWTQAGGSITNETIYTVAADPNNPDRIVAAGYQTGVYVTTDGGASWTKHTNGLPNLNFHGIIIDMDGSGRIWAGSVGNGVFYSDNDGNTWVYAGLKGSEIWDMEFIGVRQ